MKAKALKAACLAVGLATAWGSPSNAGPTQPSDQIQLTISPSNNLSHVYFLYGVNSSTLHDLSVVSLPNLLAGVSTTETFTVSHSPLADAYTVIGLYDETNKLLTVGMNSSEAERIMGNTDFSNEFSAVASSYSQPFYSEDAIATAMLSNDTTTIANAFEAEDGIGYVINMGDSGELVNFSNASEGVGYQRGGRPGTIPIQLPDSVGGSFGEAFTPVNIDHMEILTGGLPAEYGNRLAGVVNIVTKSGSTQPGGEIGTSFTGPITRLPPSPITALPTPPVPSTMSARWRSPRPTGDWTPPLPPISMPTKMAEASRPSTTKVTVRTAF